MTNTYTIIDNFDKIKLLPYEGAVETTTIPNYRETIFEEINKNDSVRNYHTPFIFTSNNQYKYMPDMFRYIVGRRFYVDSLTTYPTHQLRYPSEATLTNPSDYKKMEQPNIDFFYGISSTPDLSFGYYFDLLYAPETIDLNSKLFKNDLTFDQYYNPTAMASAPGAMPTTFSLAPGLKGTVKTPAPTLSEILAQLKVFKDKGTFNYTDELRNNILFQGLPWWPPEKLEFNSLWPHNAESGAQPLPLLMLDPAPQDILKKLLLFKIGTELPMNDPPIWIPGVSKHIYLAADLAKGTGKPTKEFDYVINTDVVLIESKYNYYSELAEFLPSNIQYEWQLPNLYTYYNLRTQKTEYYKNLVKLDQKKSVTPEEFSVQNYYETIQDSEVEPILSTAYRYKNIVVTDRDQLNNANAVSKLFPMYNKITIPSKTSDFMEMLKKKKRVNVFMTVLGNYFSSVHGELSSEHTFAVHDGTTNISTSTLQILDIAQFFASINDPNKLVKYFNDLKNVKLDPIPMSTHSEQLIGQLVMALSANEINEYLDIKRRTVSQIYKGKKCHSEVLAFEIAKFKINSKGKKEHIQSVFLPSLYSGEEISYLDTQAFYGQEYIYEIFTHSLVIGSVYNFERDGFATNLIINLFNQKGPDESTLELPSIEEVPLETKAIIVRAPYYNNDSLLNDIDGAPIEKLTTTILDKPPLPPDVSFYPYKDKSNKILVLLNVNYGEREMIPISIFAEDKEKIAAYRDTQKKSLGPITYKTDDAKGTFRVYRTQRKPTMWNDFSDAESRTLDSAINTGYNDFIEANVDYYYFARFEDVHGNISNPTAIFFVRIVKEGGFPPYLINRTYNFSEGRIIQTDRSFKKYIKIGLSEGTRELLNSAAGINGVDVGYEKAGSDSQLKKYKIRLTSKKTGKKIDINIDFAKIINTNYLNKIDKEAAILSDPNSLANADYAEDIKKMEGMLNNPDNTLPGGLTPGDYTGGGGGTPGDNT